MAKKVLIDGLDVLKEGYLVSDFPKYKGEITFQGKDILKEDSYTLDLVQPEKFALQKEKSFFYRRNIYNSYVEFIDENNVKVWSGSIVEVKRDYDTKKAIIKAISDFNKILNTNIEYTKKSVNPIQALEDILDIYGLSNLSGNSFAFSKLILENNNIAFDIIITESNGITLSEFINKIAFLCCADLYLDTNSKLQFVIEDKEIIDYTPIYTFTNNDLYKNVIITDNVDFIINNYDIKLKGLGVLSDTNYGEISRKEYGEKKLELIDLSENSSYQSSNLSVAQWIGENYINRYKKAETFIDTSITKQKFKGFIELGMLVSFNLNQEDYINNIFKIIYLEEGQQDYYNIKCRKIV